VFFRNWAGIGFAADVPESGDARPLSFLGQPLLMLRDREGTLRVFFNVCRHRGMILVDKPGKIQRAIRCPYHSWCYELDGRLRTTPHVGGPGTNRHDAIHREELGLVEVRSHECLGVVFVNIDGQAPAFEDYAAGIRARWAEFDRPLHFAPDGGFTLEVACNWKLAVENYCESYHLPWVHPGLNSYSRLEDHYHIETAGAFSGQGTRVYRPMLAEDGRRFPEFSGLTEQWREGAEYISLYPNVLLGVHKDHTFAIVLEPPCRGFRRRPLLASDGQPDASFPCLGGEPDCGVTGTAPAAGELGTRAHRANHLILHDLQNVRGRAALRVGRGGTA
jgi:phenylpropionate dioxygenase-like ring-hydroxylating dioxygenase large terminal subunit